MSGYPGVIDEPLVNLRSRARNAVSQSLLYDFVLHLRVQLRIDLPFSLSSSILSLQQVKLMQKKFLYSDAFRLLTAFSSHLARRVFVRVSNTRAWGLFFFRPTPPYSRFSHSYLLDTCESYASSESGQALIPIYLVAAVLSINSQRSDTKGASMTTPCCPGSPCVVALPPPRAFAHAACPIQFRRATVQRR